MTGIEVSGEESHRYVVEGCGYSDGLAPTGRGDLIGEPVVPLGRREVGTDLLTSIT